jgi:hypothetical protein
MGLLQPNMRDILTKADKNSCHLIKQISLDKSPFEKLTTLNNKRKLKK